ncbi:MAG: amino acid permease [Chlamydiia bacterium]|nr:amino acid permease [Chlamydiia bacterium]
MTIMSAAYERVEGEAPEAKPKEGLSTFTGVFLPCFLTFFGVIFYLRLGAILGNIGLFQTCVIVVISSLISFLTALSISATATNMQIKEGGAYYIVSRSFGVEIGSAIGLALFFAQVIGIAFFIEGFSESIRFLFPTVDPVILEMSALSLVATVALVSSSAASSTQLVVLVVIGLSLFSFLCGAPVEHEGIATLPVNSLSFWGAFAIFFPAVTGIEAGFSLAGNLQNSRRSIPVGILLAVATGLISYLLIVTILSKRASAAYLQSDPLAFFHLSAIESLSLLGVWGATLAGSMGSLIVAPRTLQALAKDAVIPKFFGKTFGTTKEPRIATLTTFFTAFVCIYFGNIDILAPILTMFFLISYGMLNLAAGLESLFGNPSWRPTFATPSAVSLSGFLLCLLAMLMIDPGQTLIALTVVTLFYLLVKRKQLGCGWDDLRQGALLFFCRFAIYRLATLGPSVRSWRPYFLVFSSSPTQHSTTIDFANSITKDKGFLTVVSIMTAQKMEYDKIESLEKLIRSSLNKKKVQCLIELEKADDPFSGIQKMVTTYGLGPITPNTLVFGYSDNGDYDKETVNILSLANQLGKNVIFLKDDGEKASGSLDIWWDESNKMNGEFMLVLAHMLSGTPRFSQNKVCVKCIVQTEEGREQREAYFHQLFAKSRLNVEIRVLVIPDQTEITTKLISRFSSNSALTFVGLDHPSTQGFPTYFKNKMHEMRSLKRAAIVMGSEKIRLNKVFDF